MIDYEPEAWIAMINSTINKHVKRIDSADFWVESLELYDRDGNVYSQLTPRLALSFK